MSSESARQAITFPETGRGGMQRRRLLALTGLPALSLLPACGGGADSATDAVSAGAQTLVVREMTLASARTYRSTSLTDFSAAAVSAKAAGLAAADDRFGAIGAALGFVDAGSWASIDALPAPLGGDFALSFWFRLESDRAVRVLTLTSGDDSRITIDLNDGAPLTVGRTGAVPARLEMRAASGLTDGEWHHLLLQCSSGSMQLVIDGGPSVVSSDGWKATGVRSAKFGGDARSLVGGSLDDIRFHDRTFSIGEVEAMVYQWQQLKPTNSDRGLIGVYQLNGNGINSMGLGWNGVGIGNLSATLDRYGRPGAASAFDGQTYIELEGDATFANRSFAMGLWFRTASRTDMTALSVADTGGQSLAVAVNDEAAVALRVNGDLVLTHGQTGLLADDSWHHLLVQRTHAGFELYVDAALLGVAPVDAWLGGPGSRLRVGGGGSPSAAESWVGALDELLVYDRSLNEAEIVDLLDFQFRPKDGAGALAFNDRIWLIGGWNAYAVPTTENEVWSTSDGEAWTLAPVPPWEGRHTAGYLVHSGKMWLLGGDRNRGHYQNEVWSSNDGATWQQINANVPWEDRVLFMSASFQGRMWVYGGVKIGVQVAYNDVFSSADGVQWRQEITSAAWSPRGIVHGALVFRDRLWVLGGGTYNPRSYLNDVWSSADGVNWELVLPAAPWEPRQFHAVSVFQGKLWVVGGVSASEPAGLADMWHSGDGIHWERLKNTPWPGRHAASVVAYGNSIWMAAGTGVQIYNDAWRMSFGE